MNFSYQILIFVILSVLLWSAESKDAQPAKSRIVGGQATTIDKHPYLVNLRKNGQFYCGGTLVNERFVVTAAHCVKDVPKSSITVHGGQTRLTAGGVARRVALIITPRDFSMETMNDDVAVIKLAGPMTGANIKPIGFCDTKLRIGDMLQVSGWGLKSERNQAASQVVQTVAVPVINRKTCAAMYRGKVPLTSTMFCASVPGYKDSCKGDSGGPAVHNGKLCGVVSWGIGCARKNYPGVYTSVRQVMPFLKLALQQ